MLIIDPNSGNIIDANPSACYFYGYDQKKFKNELFIHDLNILSPKEIKKEMDDAVKYSKQYFNFKHRIASGEIKNVEVYTTKINDDKNPYLWSIIHDITDRKKLEEDLIDSQKQYKLIAENTSDSIAILTFDEKLTYRYVNQTSQNELGFKPRQLLGKSVLDFIHPDNKKQLQKVLKKYLAIKNMLPFDPAKLPTSLSIEFKLLSKNGKWRDMRSTINLIGDELLVISKDITDIKERDRILLESKQYAENLINISPGIIVALDTDGNITLINDNGNKLLGYKKGELIGVNWFERCIPPYIKKEVLKGFGTLIKGDIDKFAYYENSIVTKSGEEIIIRWRNTLIFDKNKEIIGVLSSGEDVTKRKIAEDALLESEQIICETQRIADIGSYVLDIKSGTWKSSEILDRIFGIDKSFERTVEGWQNILHPSDRELMMNHLLVEVIQNKKPFNKEYRINRFNDNMERWVFGRGQLVYDENNAPIQMIGTIQDVTERKTLLDQIDHNRIKYEDLYDNAPDMYFTIDKNGIVLNVNENGANYLGYDKSELIGNKIWKIVHKNDTKQVKSKVVDTIKNCDSSSDLEFRKVKKDGSIIFVQERQQCIPDKDGNFKELRIVCRDITDKVKTRQKIIDYQENLKTMTYELNNIEEKTKREISSKLHDDIAQSMALSKISLSKISEDMTYSDIRKSIDIAKNYIDNAIKNSRNLTYELSPPILYELGLVAALKSHADHVKNNFNINFQFRGVQGSLNLPYDINIALYKAVVELINNIIKHSGATLVTISVNKFKKSLRITVRDNGKGFKSRTRENLSKDKKFGLFSIRERIRYLGGEFNIDSEVKMGTQIIIKIPI